MTPITASWVLLGLFLASWIAAAAWKGKSAGLMPLKVLAPLYAGGAVLVLGLAWLRASTPWVRQRMWDTDLARDWVLVVVMVVAGALCWWARLHLGQLWASGVLVREGHRVVDTGPYAIVRHPIYSAAFGGLLALAVVQARPVAFLVATGFILFFGLKARMEERFLVQQLGREYEDYRLRVPMLVPGLRLRAPPGPGASR